MKCRFRSMLALGVAVAFAMTPHLSLADDGTTSPRTAGASDPATPPLPEMPKGRALSLTEAVTLAKTRGFDVLVAKAGERGAEADVRSSGPLPNPTLSAYYGRVFNYSPDVPGCDGCSRNYYFAELSDEGLVEGLLSRKRALREAVAKRALEAAKFGRADAERVLVAEAKIQYLQAAAARALLEFAMEVATSLEESVKINRVRYPRIIDEGELLRVEQESLRAVQGVERARRAYRQEQIDLAVVIGMMGEMPEIEVDESVLRFRVPEALASADKASLLRIALENRPDRKRAQAVEAQGEAAIALAKRNRVPDMSLHLQYQQAGIGQSAVQPPTLALGVQLPLPVFYQQQGEVGRAEADRDAATIERRRLEATVSADIESAYNAFVTARSIVSRYENALLDRARRALDITRIQFDAGSATLMDLLDAQRAWVSINSDYNGELVNYWTAIFSLEQAVGKELVP